MLPPIHDPELKEHYCNVTALVLTGSDNYYERIKKK